VEHAKFHQETYGDDIMTFVSKHYGELMQSHQAEQGQEREDHEKLPFKQLTNFSSSLILVIPLESFEWLNPLVLNTTLHSFYYKNLETSFFTDRQLRPPRLS